jgi:hypothetical protein
MFEPIMFKKINLLLYPFVYDDQHDFRSGKSITTNHLVYTYIHTLLLDAFASRQCRSPNLSMTYV